MITLITKNDHFNLKMICLITKMITLITKMITVITKMITVITKHDHFNHLPGSPGR